MEIPPILVRLLLWGRHTLTLTLSQTQSAGPWRRDVLSGAHLEANFDGFDERTEDGEDDSSDESLPRWRCMMRAMGAEKSTSSSSSSSSPVVAVEDLLLLARTLPAGDDVKLVVREVAARVARAPARFRHLALLETNRGFVVNPTMQGAVVTLPTGIVATVRLSPDYPIAAPVPFCLPRLLVLPLLLAQPLEVAAGSWQSRLHLESGSGHVHFSAFP